jgi:hypothetical protein
MQFLEIFGDFGILGFSKILGFFQRFFGIFDEVYEDFQSNLPLGCITTNEKLVHILFMSSVRNVKHRQAVTRFRISAHRFPVEARSTY